MEIKTNKQDLEQTLSDIGNKDKPKAPEMSKEEEIGFHKGALNTLSAERNELIKIVANVEAIMQAHLKRLEELGVKIPVQEAPSK